MKQPLVLNRMPKMFQRMFWRNYALFALVATLFMAVLCARTFYETFHQYRDANTRIATNLAQTTAQWLSDCQQMSVSVGQSASLLELADADQDEMDFSELDAVLLSQAQHALVAARATRTNVSHLALYLYNREYVVTDAGTLPLDEFYGTLFATPATPQSPYLRRLGPGRFLFLRQGEVSDMRPQEPVYVTSAIDPYGSQYGNLFIFWDSRTVSQSLTSTAKGGYYAVFDADGNAMFCSDATYLPQEDYLRQLDDTGEQPAQRTVGSFSDWTVYAGFPVSDLHGRLWQRGLLLLLAWLLVLAAGSAAIMALCRKNYAPISALARAISEHSPEGISPEMEYEALTAAITSITDSKKNAEEQLEIYKPVLINSLLIELLDGLKDQSVTLTALRALGCSFPYPIWQCFWVEGEGLRLDDVMSMAEKLRSSGGLSCFAASYNRRSCVFLINGSSEWACTHAAEALENLLDAAPEVRAWGASETVREAAQLETAHLHARQVPEYAALDSGSKGGSWEALASSGIFALRPPTSLNQLAAAFSVGRIPEARDALQDYFSRIVYNGYARKDTLTFLQDRLSSALKRLTDEYGAVFSYDSLLEWTPTEPGSIRRLYEAAVSACDSAQQALERCRCEQQKNSASSFLVYLNDHLFDEALSLTTLADHFHVSESAASRRIRALTDMNFLDYVNKKRVEHAAALLMHSEGSINDLARKVGYTSDITFRRVFKKYMGMTPSEYRNSR